MTRPLRRFANSAGPAALLLLTFAACSSRAAAARPGSADAGVTAANIVRVTTSLLQESQFSHHPLDVQLAGKLLDRYVDALDGTRSLLLQSDVDEMARNWSTLVLATPTTGDTRAAHLIFARYLERLGQQVTFATELLRTAAFDFTAHDRFGFDREHAPRPRDLTAAHVLWRQEIRAEYLQEKLTDRKPADIV